MITKQQLRKLGRLEAAATIAQRKVNEFRKSIIADCDHPAECVSDYSWEHDNGYGRQTRMTGKICNLCHQKDIWNRGQFYGEKW